MRNSLLLTLAVPVAACACSCMIGGPPCADAWKASAVFAGTVEQVTYDSSGRPYLRVHVRFEVTEPFIGMEGRGKQVEVLTGSGGGDCGFPFHCGHSYLVYAYQSQESQLATGICSRTAELDHAQADLTYLRSLANGTPTYVYGLAGDGESQPRFDEALGVVTHPGIPGATVTLAGKAMSRRLVTGPDGSFRFDGLAPGRYTVTVSKDGYSLRGEAAGLDVHAGGCGFASPALVVDRRIAGRVTGADGLPAAHVQVELVRSAHGRESTPVSRGRNSCFRRRYI